MTRTVRQVRFLICAALLLAGALSPARADGPSLTATFGIGGHYRLGGWCPVTVTVLNGDGSTLSGQVQVLGAENPGGNTFGRPDRMLGASIFARPITLSNAPGPQSLGLSARGLDPGRDSVTVQLVEGRTRGDGRVLAQINSQDTKTSQAITAYPLNEGDVFLVGFGGDPASFTMLNGQKLGMAHQAGGGLVQNGGVGAAPPGGTPATVQVAEAAPTDLPDKAAGYAGVDAVLIRADAPLDALTEAQADALRGWVAGGGRLLVCGGVDPGPFASSFFTALLPAAVGAAKSSVLVPGIGPVGALTLTPKPLPGVQTLQAAPDKSPLVVSGPYGAGRVTLAAYDPTSKPFQAPGGSNTPLWQMLLGGGYSSSLLQTVAMREENVFNPQFGWNGSNQSQLSDVVMRGGSLDAPGTGIIGLFLVVYLIVLVPVNTLILKRLDRRELAWVTIPGLVLLFAVGTYAVGYAAKGGSLFVNRAALVETSAGQRQAGVYADIGLFSPHRTDYDLSVSAPNALAAIPNPSYGFRPGGQGRDAETYGPTKFVQTGEGASLLDASVNMWAMRAFDVQSTTDLGGTIDAVWTGKNGVIANHTPHTLTECVLFIHGVTLPVGELKPGASVPVRDPGFSGTSLSTFPGSSAFSPGSGMADEGGSVHQRIHTALTVFAQSLVQPASNPYGNQPPMSSFSAAPNEALLVGWSEDADLAGPAVRVDGRAVKQNNLSLVVVHLPLPPASSLMPPISRLRFTIPPPPPRTPSSFVPYGMVARSSPMYKQARDVESFDFRNAKLGQPVKVHGRITSVLAGPKDTLSVFKMTLVPPACVAVRWANLGKFPDLQQLQGREVLVSGKITRVGTPQTGIINQVLITQPSQIKIVY